MNKKIKLLLTLFFLHISHLTASQEQESKDQQSQEVTYCFSMCVPFVIKVNKSSNPQRKTDKEDLEVKALEANRIKKHVEALSKLYGFPIP